MGELLERQHAIPKTRTPNKCAGGWLGFMTVMRGPIRPYMRFKNMRAPPGLGCGPTRCLRRPGSGENLNIKSEVNISWDM